MSKVVISIGLSLAIIFLLTACTSKSQTAHEPVETGAKPLPAAAKITQPYEIVLAEDAMKDPYGIAINSKGQIFVSDAGNNRVLQFTASGDLIGKWDQQGSSPGEFSTMGFGGLATDSQDNVFVVDNNNYRIQKFDRDGNYITSWGSKGTEPGQFVRVIGIAVDVEGNVYVTDDENPYVQKFDNTGKFIMRFGGPGTSNGAFKHATGIAVDQASLIYVADYETKLIQKFAADGSFLLSWQLEEGRLKAGTPEGIVIDTLGNILVSDYDQGQVFAYSNQGVFLWSLSDKLQGLEELSRPTAMAIDDAGNLYIVNQRSARITVVPLP